MNISNPIIFTADSFQNNTLYNSALILNPGGTTSLRIGNVTVDSKTGQEIVNRTIEQGYRVEEKNALFMADYNLNTKEFSVLYYPSCRPVKIPLTKYEQDIAIHEFKKRFFVSNKEFSKFTEQACATSGIATDNVYDKCGTPTMLIGGLTYGINKNLLIELGNQYLPEDIDPNEFATEITWRLSEKNIEPSLLDGRIPEEYFFNMYLAYTKDYGFQQLLFVDDQTVFDQYGIMMALEETDMEME